MISYYKVIQNALHIYYKRDEYCYFYAAKGQRMTDVLMDALIQCEPEYWKRYTPEKIRKIKDFSRGKIGVDCSGFINLCTGQEKYSTAYYEQTLNKTTPANGTEGNLLYTTFGGTGRHVGLDIGYGYFLSFDKELETCKFGKISAYRWENSGQLSDVDYTGAKN